MARTRPPDHRSAILSPMRILIGVDEAGYGSNLGPLVVAISTQLDPHGDASYY